MDSAESPPVVEETYRRLVVTVVEHLRSLGPICTLAGDARHPDPWEEFKVQVQGERSPLFYVYEATLFTALSALVDSLPEGDAELLWRWTRAGAGHLEVGALPTQRDLRIGLKDEVYRRTVNFACDEELWSPDC